MIRSPVLASIIERFKGDHTSGPEKTVFFSPIAGPSSSAHLTAYTALTVALLALTAAASVLLAGYLGKRLLARPETIAAESIQKMHPLEQETDLAISPAEPGTVEYRPVQETTTPTATPVAVLAKAARPTKPPIPTPTSIDRTRGARQTGVHIARVPAGLQERNLSCELQSASDLAYFYGRPLAWETIFMAVGHDPNGNPHVGFVGSSLDDAPRQLYPNGYGVYARPIAHGLQSLGLNAIAYSGMGVEWLQREIRAGRPVIVWAPFDMEAAELTGWYTADGETWVTAVRGEHTFTVIGYNKGGVFVNDPWYGRERFFTWPAFEQAWDTLGQMAVSVQPNLQK